MSTLRQAWRSLVREPGFTTTALLTLALGIGVSTAMFSFVDAVLLRPVGGIADEDRLMLVGEAMPTDQTSGGPFTPSSSAPVFFAWREQNAVFSHVGASTIYPGDVLITGGERAESLKSRGASAGFFEALGIQPLLGRSFRLDEERAGSERVVLLTHRYWQSRFGADARVLGTSMRVNGEPHTIVGILPATRVLDSSTNDIWLPLAMEADEIHPRNFFLAVHGRLKPGVTASQAEADLDRIEAALKEDGRAVDKALIVRVKPYRDHVVGRDMRRATLLLGGAVACVLLIACINLAHLLVARYARTRRDVAVRVALGASRAQLTRRFLAESLLLCLAGGAAGVLIASWLVRGLLTLMPPTMFVHDVHVTLDARVLVFAGALSTLTGVIFGLLPTLTFARADLRASGLNVWASTSGGGASRPFARHALLVGEVALTLTLVSGSTLLLGSLVQLLAIDPGFRTARTVALSVRLDRERYGSIPAILGYQDAMLARIRALPGVASAAASNMVPLTGRNSSSGVWIVGLPGSRTGAGQRFVSPDYFTTMGITVVRGRGLTAADGLTAPRVVVINETYARVLGRFRDPLGAELQFQGRPATVVGIARDVKHRDLTSAALNEIFAPLAQAPEASFLSQLAFVVHTTEPPAALVRALTQIAGTADPNVAVVNVRTMDDYLTASIAQPRFLSALSGLFGALALGLTAVGIYGVLSSVVSERTRELAIRLALGAQKREVLHLVMRTGLAVTCLGVVLGFGGALLVGRALSSLLFEVSATDPRLYAGAGALLAAVALIACYLPARRATKSDPLVVLRAER